MTLETLRGAAILFDLDGTLVDTAPDLAAAMNAVLVAEGRPPLPPESVRNLVGHGARALLERGFAASGDPIDEPATMEALVAAFIDHYAAHIADASRPFPGCIETLRALRAAGAGLAVCTNKPERLSHLLLDALDMSDLFACVCGADTTSSRKPSPEPLFYCMDRLGTRERAVMVGDSSTDVKAARAAGAPIALARFGYLDATPDELGPDAAFDAYPDLPDTLARLLGA